MAASPPGTPRSLRPDSPRARAEPGAGQVSLPATRGVPRLARRRVPLAAVHGEGPGRRRGSCPRAAEKEARRPSGPDAGPLRTRRPPSAARAPGRGRRRAPGLRSFPPDVPPGPPPPPGLLPRPRRTQGRVRRGGRAPPASAQAPCSAGSGLPAGSWAPGFPGVPRVILLETLRPRHAPALQPRRPARPAGSPVSRADAGAARRFPPPPAPVQRALRASPPAQLACRPGGSRA